MEYHVFVKKGDARAEVDSLLKDSGEEPAATGFHKYIYVAQARQTVVMLSGPEAPLAAVLRGREGWQEPGAGH